MLRSGQVNTIREMAVQGKPVRAIARELGLARNTVRRYVRGTPAAVGRAPRASKLDPFTAQIRRWVREDHLYNCETMLPRLRAQGYTGQISILKAFVHPLRPLAAGMRQPVVRYETRPGEQMQFDIRNFKISCMVDRGQISQQIAGIQSERVEASGGGGAWQAIRPGYLW